MVVLQVHLRCVAVDPAECHTPIAAGIDSISAFARTAQGVKAHASLPNAVAIPPDSNIAERVPIYVLRDDDDPEQIA